MTDTLECTKQHPFTPENTYMDPEGVRRCRTCRRGSKARARATKRDDMFMPEIPERDTTPDDWRMQAECTKHDPDLWFPNEGDHETVRKALNICYGCPVRDLCLREAVETKTKDGIWGGQMPGSHARKKRKA